MQTSVRSALRARMNDGAVSVWAGAHDALSGRLVERAGFDGVWASSFGISLSSRCVPDVDLVTMAETLDIVRNIVSAVGIPVIADCNAGFGNAVNVLHMIRDFERAGVAGVCIEDNAFPKCCSLYDRDHRVLASREEMAGKIRAAVHARVDPDLVIIARVESLIAGHGVAAALRRARAYADAGADAVVVHAKSWDLLQQFLAVWDNRCPLIAIPTLYNHVPLAELANHGYRVVIFPNQAVRAAVHAMRHTLEMLRQTGLGSSVDHLISPLAEVNALAGLAEVEETEAAFLATGEPDDESYAPLNDPIQPELAVPTARTGR
jgi:phosphoenolpyruvate phosphomutase